MHSLARSLTHTFCSQDVAINSNKVPLTNEPRLTFVVFKNRHRRHRHWMVCMYVTFGLTHENVVSSTILAAFG